MCSIIIILSFPKEPYACQIVPSQCLAQPMAMLLAVVRSWGEQPVSIMGQTSRCCMVCLMPQSQVSCSLGTPHFNMFTLDRPTCVRNRLSAFQVVQGISVPAGRCSSALMLKAKMSEISIDTHQLHYIPLYHFTIIFIIIIFDTVATQKRNIEHEKQ